LATEPQPESSQNEQDQNAKDCEVQTSPFDAGNASTTTGTDSLPPTNAKTRVTFLDVITDPIIKHAIMSSGPEQPPGPFPKNEKQDGRLFSKNSYYSTAKSGLQLRRNWLCYSTEHDSVYCQPCWLYNFFGKSIVRWQDLQTPTEEENISKTTIKTLNPTRFSGTQDSTQGSEKKIA